MGSESISTRKKEREGFSEFEVGRFFQQGNTLSTASTSLDDKPSLQKTTISTTRNRSSGVFGNQNSKTQTTQGFQGRFSDISAEDLDKAASLFNARRELIERRRLAPGQDQLFLSNP